MENVPLELSENVFERKTLISFFIYSFALFWLLLIITGLVMLLGLPEIFVTIMKNVAAWAPTFAILILIKKISPNKSFWKYIKESFNPKINPLHFFFSLLIQIGIFGLAIGCFLLTSDNGFESLTFIPLSMMLMNVIVLLSSGPLGEELGWRHYALNQLQQKYSPLKSSLILGSLWGLWHMPLWFLSGYIGIDLVLYIVGFMIGIIATGLLITYFYNKSKNMSIAIWIHFWFNYLLNLLDVSAEILLKIFLWSDILYLIIVLIIILSNIKVFTESLSDL